jgi:hypothetical protein
VDNSEAKGKVGGLLRGRCRARAWRASWVRIYHYRKKGMVDSQCALKVDPMVLAIGVDVEYMENILFQPETHSMWW